MAINVTASSAAKPSIVVSQEKHETYCESAHNIVTNYCSRCKSCCSDLNVSGDRSEIICAFNAIQTVLSGTVPEDQIKKLIVIEVPEKIMDEYALYLRMHPLTNLLKQMTTPSVNGTYRFLAIPPATVGKCPFLSPTGCTQTGFKAYICDIYPFYVHKLIFHADYNCPWVDSMEEVPMMYREKVGKYIVDFLLFAGLHRNEYQTAVDQIIKKYNLQIVPADPDLF